MIDQVEFANVIVINKIDLVPPEEHAELNAILRKLNPSARIMTTERGKAPLSEILATNLFDMEKARTSAGWIQELKRIHTPETEEYAIGSFVLRARRPFHRERFWNFVHNDWRGLLRSKGFFWLATRNDIVGGWSQAGGSAEHRPAGIWWAAVPKDHWPTQKEVRDYIEREWHSPYGDRRQELVFIRQDLPKVEMLAALQGCLLDDQEMTTAADQWKTQFSDPFASWNLQEGEDHQHAH